MEQTLMEQRQKKRELLLQKGIEPYGRRFERTLSLSEVRAQFKETKEVQVAGRLMTIRGHGRSSFADIKDEKARFQIYVREEELGKEEYSLFEILDLGDWIGCAGKLFTTKKGEKTIHVSKFWVLAKNIRPLPEKWHGLKDVETRFRQRYVDLAVNDQVREVFFKRTGIIRKIREELDRRGFLEVETPMMQPIPGGAVARPFITHHNALDIDLYLRIAPELYLKRLLVGGIEKVYEINRNFRNEGLSRKHNPEFTMLEVYQAFADYTDMMELCQDLIVAAASVCGSDLESEKSKAPWKRISYWETFRQMGGVDLEREKDLRGAAARLGVEIPPGSSPADLMNSLFEKLVETKLSAPTFVIDYPAFLCPLAKAKAGDPRLAERFELYIEKTEIANAYTEQNDPVIQRQRFQEQLEEARKDAGHAPVMDEDYLRALEYGMPPAGGLGVGVDRLVMLLTRQESLREVILFPQMKPEGSVQRTADSGQ